MPDIFGGDPITEAEAEKAEEMANGHPCSNCGRSNDWLARGRFGDFILLDCDDCCIGTVKVKLPPTPNREEQTCPPESAVPRRS